MTSHRYLSYRTALALLGASVTEADESEEVAVVRAQAQDLLLTRAHEEDEVEDLEQHAASALRDLVATGALTTTVAVEIWRTVRGCGPPRAPLARESAHAIL